LKNLAGLVGLQNVFQFVKKHGLLIDIECFAEALGSEFELFGFVHVAVVEVVVEIDEMIDEVVVEVVVEMIELKVQNFEIGLELDTGEANPQDNRRNVVHTWNIFCQCKERYFSHPVRKPL